MGWFIHELTWHARPCMAAVIFHSEKYTAAHMVYCVAFDISLRGVFSAMQCFYVTRQSG